MRCAGQERAVHEAEPRPSSVSTSSPMQRGSASWSASYCTRLQVKASDDTTPSPKAISKRLRCGRVKNWQVRYNVAFCYSRYMEHNPGSLSTKIKRRVAR